MENETVKLVNVLRRIARSAAYSAWMRSDLETARFCAAQYNRVLRRLSELQPNLQNLFSQLTEDTSPEVTRIASRELIAYFEDEVGESQAWAFGWRRAPRVIRVPLRCD